MKRGAATEQEELESRYRMGYKQTPETPQLAEAQCVLTSRLLHGFTKKTGPVPHQYLETAQGRRDDYISRRK